MQLIKNIPWDIKYKPLKLEDFIFENENLQQYFTQIIEKKSIPHLLLQGPQGTGKTTLANILINECGIDPIDVKIINASDENNVETVRETIKSFVTTASMGEYKVVLLDEADYISQNGQAILRGLMLDYADVASFILTCVTGDTKVYTPHGCMTIDSTKTDDNILSNKLSLLANKYTKVSFADRLIQINTNHGHQIEVTPEHQLLTLKGSVKAAELLQRDSVLINIAAMYGNSFKYEKNIDFFDPTDFKSWLVTEKNIPTISEIDFLLQNKHFVFSISHQNIFDWVRHTGVEYISPLSISKSIDGISITSARNYINKIKKFLEKKTRNQNDFIEYSIDASLFDQYDNFIDQYQNLYNKEYDIATRYNIYGHRAADFSVEGIVDSLNLDFTDDKILAMGRLIGMLHGDGHISTNIHFAADNQSTLFKIIDDINNFKQIEVNIVKNGKNTEGVCICFSDKPLMLLFEYFGAALGNKTKQYRTLPKQCKTSVLFSKGFLQGLFDADSCWCFVQKTNGKTISPIILSQHFLKDQIDETFTQSLVELLNTFGIDCSVRHAEPTGGYGSHLDDRMIKQIQIMTQSAIKQYLLCIGNYYDKPISDDILGYLMYKENQVGYSYFTFNEWKQTYYIDGHINDSIISIINREVGNIPVYDCCFDEYHWYITNGFVSHNCNYINKIIPALRSRCEEVKMIAGDKNEIAEHVVKILIKEKIKIDVKSFDIIDKHVAAGYPDIRKIIKLVQQHVINNELRYTSSETYGDYKSDMMKLIEKDDWRKLKDIVVKNVSNAGEYEEVYRFLYTNLHHSKTFKDQDNYDSGIVTISEFLFRHYSYNDPEINFAACAISLGMIGH